MFEQAFKNIDDVLWKEAGCTTELDYTEQTSWLLFLKYLDDLEQDNERRRPSLTGKKYDLHPRQAVPLGELGRAEEARTAQFDHNKALTGDDLIDFVNEKLFPYLHGFKQQAERRRTRSNTRSARSSARSKTRFRSGYNLREHLDHIDELRFRSQQREARAVASLRSQDQEHGQRRAQRRRVLHAAPAHPRHDPGGASRRSASASMTAPAARRASSASRSTI